LINARVGLAVSAGELAVSKAEVELGGINAALHREREPHRGNGKEKSADLSTMR